MTLKGHAPFVIVVDCRGKAEILCALLYEPDLWRQRAVDEIVLSNASWEQRYRSLQAGPLENVLKGLPPFHECEENCEALARMIIPIGSFPKGPLLDFTLAVANNPAHLLSRGVNASFQAQYLKFLAEKASLPSISNELQLLMGAICGFTAGPWRHYLQKRRKLRMFRNANKAQHEYLEDGLGRTIPEAILDQWMSKKRSIAELVSHPSSPSSESASENPLLALPDFAMLFVEANGRAVCPKEISRLLDEFYELLYAADRQAQQDIKSPQSKAAGDFLRVYSDYGHHWDAFADCVVPLHGFFKIQVSEKRALDLRKSKGDFLLCRSMRLVVVLKDAKSNHVSLRISDAFLELGKRWHARDERTLHSYPLIAASREAKEIYAFYEASSRRPYRIQLQGRLWQTGSRRLTNAVVFLITASSAYSLWRAGEKSDVKADALAILLIPASIAASLLLIRPNSTLGAKVNRNWHIVNSLLLLLLWGIALYLYVGNHIV